VPKASQEGAFKTLTAALGGVHRPLALLQLACDLCHLDASLAKFHAKTLLRAGKEVLRGAASVEHRLYAVRLLKDAMRSCSAAVFQAELRDVVALLREAANHPKLKPEALAAGKAIQEKKKHIPRPGATSSASKAAARWRPDDATRTPHAHPADGPCHATPGAGSSSRRSPAWMGAESDESKVGEGRQHGWTPERRAEGEGEGPTSPTHSAASSSAAHTAPLALAPAVPALAAARATSQSSEPPPRDPTLYFTPLPALPHHASSLHSSTCAAAAPAEAEAGGVQGAAASEGSPAGQFTAFQARGDATFTTTAVHGSALSATPPPSAPYSARSPASLSHLGPSPSLYLGAGSTQGKAFVSSGHGGSGESPEDMRSVRRRVFHDDEVPRDDAVPWGRGGRGGRGGGHREQENVFAGASGHKAMGLAVTGNGAGNGGVMGGREWSPTSESSRGNGHKWEQENAGAGASGHKAMGRAGSGNGAGDGGGIGGREWSPTSESSRGNARSSVSPSTSGEGREAVRGGKARSPHSRGNSPLYELAAAFVRARKSPDLSGRLGTFSLTSGSPDMLGAYRLGGSRMAGGALGDAAGGGVGRGNPMRITLSDSAMAPDSAHARDSLGRSLHLASPFSSPLLHSQPAGSMQAGRAGGVGEGSGQEGFLLHLPPHAGPPASAQGGNSGGVGSRSGVGGGVGMGSSGVFVRLSGEVEHGAGAPQPSTDCKVAGEGVGGGGSGAVGGGGSGAVLAAHLATGGEGAGTLGSAGDKSESAQASAAAGSSPGSSRGSGEGSGEGSSEGEGSSGFCRLISDAEVASALASMRATHALSALRCATHALSAALRRTPPMHSCLPSLSKSPFSPRTPCTPLYLPIPPCVALPPFILCCPAHQQQPHGQQ
ncbi:unnamed protein product, partial [Closterium sp. NIES-53]